MFKQSGFEQLSSISGFEQLSSVISKRVMVLQSDGKWLTHLQC